MDTEALLEQHYAARGGLEAIRAVQMLALHGTVTLKDGTVLDMHIRRKRPDRLLVEFTINGSTGREGYDGSRAWEWFPWDAPTAQVVSGKAATALRRAADFDGPLVDWQHKGHKLDYAGTLTFEGVSAHCLLVTLADGNQITHYFDRSSALLIATETLRPVHAGSVQHTFTYFDDYRPTAGVLFAHILREHTPDGSHQESTHWREIRVNETMPDSLFALPDASASR